MYKDLFHQVVANFWPCASMLWHFLLGKIKSNWNCHIWTSPPTEVHGHWHTQSKYLLPSYTAYLSSFARIQLGPAWSCFAQRQHTFWMGAAVSPAPFLGHLFCWQQPRPTALLPFPAATDFSCGLLDSTTKSNASSSKLEWEYAK